MVQLKHTLPIGLIIVGISTLLSPAHAKKLYKYQDENGRWHFSDKPPITEQKVISEHLEVHNPKQMVFVQNRGSDQHAKLYVVNNYHGPIEFELQLKKSQNVESSFGDKRHIVVPGNRDLHIGTIQAIEANQYWHYQYDINVTLGNPNKTPDINARYQTPFAQPNQFIITQAFHGSFSHTDKANQYAVDIGMPEGTPILAARAGVVMAMQNDFHKSGTHNKNFAYKANAIRILHDDGTMAVYAHLQLESSTVTPGQRVKAGTHIGNSGNTGYSTGPHLHFSIQRNQGMELQSIPFKFSSIDSEAFTPVVGKTISGSLQISD